MGDRHRAYLDEESTSINKTKRKKMKKENLLNIELGTAVVDTSAGEVKMKELTTSDRETYELSLQRGTAKNLKATLISKSVITDEGSRMFGDDEIAKISQMPSSVSEKIFNAILVLNGMAENSEEEAVKK